MKTITKHPDLTRKTLRGCTIPSIGFGTYRLKGREGEDSVLDALECGYRHIDTAQQYNNEREVGSAIRRSGIPREDIFLTDKVWYDRLRPEEVYESYSRSLDKLGTDYVDLLLIHWPAPDGEYMHETLQAFYELKLKGLVRWTGVSNFTPELTRKAITESEIICNQVEYHPFLAQDALLALSRDFDYFLIAYSPIARGAVFDDKTITGIAGRHGKSAAQVSLRWLVQQPNVVAIPRSQSGEHRRANLEIFDFELSEEEMQSIASLERGQRIIDPEHAPEWQ